MVPPKEKKCSAHSIRYNFIQTQIKPRGTIIIMREMQRGMNLPAAPVTLQHHNHPHQSRFRHHHWPAGAFLLVVDGVGKDASVHFLGHRPRERGKASGHEPCHDLPRGGRDVLAPVQLPWVFQVGSSKGSTGARAGRVWVSIARDRSKQRVTGSLRLVAQR